MSVTVSLVPIALLSAIIPGIQALGSSITTVASEVSAELNNAKTSNIQQLHIETPEIFNRELKTNLVDRDTLVKTLLEHGCVIEKEVGNCIKCTLENLELEFYKENTNSTTPYTVKIENNGSYSAEEFINNTATGLLNDINSEYSINAQEVSYNKIKERLEEKNMQIENEEVFEDDTIVITVNLD